MRQLYAFLDDESGATAIEYGLLATMISVFLISAAYTLGNRNLEMWTKISDHVGSNTP